MTSDQIAGIALGVIFFIFLLLLAAYLLRRLVQRRRRKLASLRQQITPPEGHAMAGAVVNGGQQSSGSSGGLTGEGEVRIVIRPAPSRDQRSQAWPMPPGQEGQTYSFFVEENSGQPTAETTPADPRAWSIASEWGGSASPEAGASRRNSAVPSSNVLGSRRESRDMSARNSGMATSSFFEGASTATWMTQGQRPSGSSQGWFGTRLAPPPPTHAGVGRGGGYGEGPAPGLGRGNGNGNGGENGNVNGGGPRYNYGSLGIERAV